MVSPIKPTTTRDLILHSNGEQNYIEVLPHHTLSDVRLLVLEELDTEQLPPSCSKEGEDPDFAFRVDNIRISEKQEKKKLAVNLIEKGVRVELVPKRAPVANNNKRALDDVEEECENKRAKTDGFVTPFEKRSEENADTADESMGMTEGDTVGMVPTDLDDKFVKKNDEEGEYLSSSESTVPLEDTESTEVVGKDAENNEDAGGIGEFIGVITDHLSPNRPRSEDKDAANEKVDVDANAESDKSEKNGNVNDSNTKDRDAERQITESHDMDEELEVVTEQNPHKEADEAKEKSKQVLSELKKILQENPNFCTDTRRIELLEDINETESNVTPRTVFGVLGNTGVGKSSLLNALLEEASVLPTSGSRGCTAAVVELVYNSELVNESTHPDEKVPVYKGEVEFITLEDWRKELKVLVEECSTQDKTVYARPPQPDAMPDAAAAWQKIEQVYGNKSMERFCEMETERVFHILANDMQVKKLLTSTEPEKENNSIYVNIGEVTPGSVEAKDLLKPFSKMNRKAKTAKKKWATEFRAEINNYVYRKGNGDSRQTWPLIHKVELRGPWHVLSTGACLVDLPGIRDSNAARAKVAERYLQNCNQIAIVASIKRAVDDGTAKELMGEQFKRRLLMDGNYGNVFFICTQTDDLEATETMRDHQDIAEEVAGRWEKMCELADVIAQLESKINSKQQEKEDLDAQLEDAKLELKETLNDLNEAQKEAEDCDDEEEREETLTLVTSLKTLVLSKEAAVDQANEELAIWKDKNSSILDQDQAQCDSLQKKLKSICAEVRNEYSKRCLQEDFKSGLKELYRKDDDDMDDSDETNKNALPDDFGLDVFCISANDYLKLMSIKPRRDGPPSTFSSAHNTQIPQLRSHVHKCTASFSQSSVKAFVENTKDLLDRVKLIAGDIEDVPTGRSGLRMKSVFQTAMSNLSASIEPISLNFKKELDKKIDQNLAASLKTGALKGGQEAMSTVHSWGSKSRRTKDERRPDKNGLYWSTYNAVARRDGVYTSPSVGPIDFNQELCDPMEKEFSTEWQAVLDALIRRLLNDAEKKVLELCTTACQSLANGLRQLGVDSGRLASMLNTANRSALSALKSAFHRMQVLAVDSQRELSRELLPSVKDKMKTTYEACVGVERGSGRFDRMKGAMSTRSQMVVRGMFDDASALLLNGIKSMIDRLKRLILATSEVISKSIDSVFSILWDNNKTDKTAAMDPELMKIMRDCRNALLPDLNELVDKQQSACKLLGIEREDIELDVLGVETFEQSLGRKLEEAKQKGAVFDFCNDEDDDKPTQEKNCVRVKSEKSHTGHHRANNSIVQNTDVIDLCDSDDDEENQKLPVSGGTAVKEESCMI